MAASVLAASGDWAAAAEAQVAAVAAVAAVAKRVVALERVEGSC